MLVHCLSLVAFAVFCSTAYADPQATRDDIEIRRILNVTQGTIRIAKDPRDDMLYILRQDGAIERIDLTAATRVPTYSHRDHGISSRLHGLCHWAGRLVLLGIQPPRPPQQRPIRPRPRDFARRRHRRAAVGTARSGQPARRGSHRRHPRRLHLWPRPYDQQPLRPQDQRRHRPRAWRAWCTRLLITASSARAPCLSTLRAPFTSSNASTCPSTTSPPLPKAKSIRAAASASGLPSRRPHPMSGATASTTTKSTR